MKFFIAIALFAAVASARILPADVNLTPTELAEIEEIMAAIHSPSTDPTTAAMLEQMLYDLLGIQSPVHIPAIIDEYEPIHVGPAVVDFPVTDTGLIPDAPAPPAPSAPTTNPLVQIVVNVQGQGSPSPVQVDQVGKPRPPTAKPTPVHVVDEIEGIVLRP